MFISFMLFIETHNSESKPIGCRPQQIGIHIKILTTGVPDAVLIFDPPVRQGRKPNNWQEVDDGVPQRLSEYDLQGSGTGLIYRFFSGLYAGNYCSGCKGEASLLGGKPCTGPRDQWEKLLRGIWGGDQPLKRTERPECGKLPLVSR